MVEFAIDQGLAEICCGFAVVGWQTCGGIGLAHRDVRQVAGVEIALVHEQICRAGVAGANVKSGREPGTMTRFSPGWKRAMRNTPRR